MRRSEGFLLGIPDLQHTHKPDMAHEWAGEEYAKYNEPQREWALDFVHRSLAKELGGPTTGTGDLRQTAMTGDVLDLGCGDGSVSAWIATRKLPVARVVAVDTSKGQLDYARKAYHSVDNLSFHLASATELPDEWRDRFDMVLSFTALHWVRDHAAVLRQAHKVLKPGGLLAFTMVLAGPREFTPVLDIVAALAPWRDHLQHYAPPTYPANSGWTEEFILAHHPGGCRVGEDEVQDEQRRQQLFVEAYRHLLTRCGFEVETLEVVPAKANADNAEELKQFVAQWLPHKQRIPEPQQEAFIDEVVDAYLRHTEQSRAKGELHMWFDLLQVKARKRAG